MSLFFTASEEASPEPAKIEENDADYEESTNNDDIDRLSVTSISVTVASLAALSDIADPLGEQGDLQSLACPIGTPMKREAVDNNDSKSDVSSYCREPLRKKAAVEGKYFYHLNRFCILAIKKVRKRMHKLSIFLHCKLHVQSEKLLKMSEKTFFKN